MTPTPMLLVQRQHDPQRESQAGEISRVVEDAPKVDLSADSEFVVTASEIHAAATLNGEVVRAAAAAEWWNTTSTCTNGRMKRSTLLRRRRPPDADTTLPPWK